MRIGIIHYRKQPPWSAEQLIRAARELGHEPVYIRIQDIDAGLLGGRPTAFLHRERLVLDAAVVRGIGLSYTHELFLKRIDTLHVLEDLFPLINPVVGIIRARDKWLSLYLLAKNGVPVPDTFITENPFTAKRLVEKYGRMVYKPLTGSLGLGSTLISDPEIGFQVMRSLSNYNQPGYLQEYVEKPGYDIRVFVVGGRVVAAMKRVSTGGWKTNIAQGARGVELREKDDPEAYELGIRAAEILGLEYAGVDIVVDSETGRRLVIEVNAFPIWRGLQEATGRNPAKDIIMHLIELTRR